MTLKEYFNSTKGTGILATADSAGRTDAAIYSRPHIMDDGSLAFIMRPIKPLCYFPVYGA
jgi:hypothetical protein